MPGHSGLELLDFFESEVDFTHNFTTAYNEYALQPLGVQQLIIY